LEKHPPGQLRRAVEKGLAVRAITRDAIAQFLYPRQDWRATLFSLDGHPHLRAVRVAVPNLARLSRTGGRYGMNKEPSVLLLEHHLKVLKLLTFLRDCASVGAVCSQERADYPTYLLRLAERELIDRERRATGRRIKEAPFLVLKTIETFAFAAQPSINEPLVRELLRGE
jgi:hypothetical protein